MKNNITFYMEKKKFNVLTSNQNDTISSFLLHYVFINISLNAVFMTDYKIIHDDY